MEGRARAPAQGPFRRDPRASLDPAMNSKSRALGIKNNEHENCLTPVQCVFLTFSYPSHLKHLVLRAFLEDGLPEML